MKLTRLSLTLASLVLSAGLLRADLTRTGFSKKGEWTVSSLTDNDGNFVRAEMLRTYNTKQEVHLRIGFDGENFHIDSSANWSQIPDAKSHEAEYRIDSAANESAWKGKAKVVEEADGMTWLRITEPNQPGVGDGIGNAKKLFIYVGPLGESVEWNFDLKQSIRAQNEISHAADSTQIMMAALIFFSREPATELKKRGPELTAWRAAAFSLGTMPGLCHKTNQRCQLSQQ